ncbi:MAG: SurA N-terminal domain-containing protein [Dysgonamonadaceae bacterium]|jgi:peptidyl-prolyl cis-trans isomerase D|nr:SurA N-terminal domain-containing protein [Dysgonamonadaceae bacterium]
MATLEKIRSRAALLVIVVGIALLAFVVGDFLKSGSTFFQQKQENIINVNGETLDYRDFQTQVEDRTNALKQNTNRSFTDDEQNQIRQMVLNEAIDNILFSEEAKKIGLTVGKEESKDLLMGNNISPMIQQYFQNPQTGRFDKTALLQFLQTIENDDYTGYPEDAILQMMQQKKAWLAIEEQVIREQLRRKFSVLVASAVLTNDLEIKAQTENDRISVDFDYVAQAYGTIPSTDISVSDAEIQQLYNERKNQFKQEEAKVIDYIAHPIAPSPDDYQAVENKLTTLKEQIAASGNIAELIQTHSDIPYLNAYQAYSGLDADLKQLVDVHPVGAIEGPVLVDNTYHLYKIEGERVAPDSIRLYALMLPMMGTEEQIKHLSDSLIRVVKSGTPFTEMVSSASGGQTNGDLGWVTEAMLVSQVDAQFKDEVFNAPVDVPAVVQSGRGSFLVQVTEKTKPVKKYKIANLQIRVTPSQETKTRLYNELSQYVSNNHSLTTLKENAGNAGFNIQTDVEVTKEQINIGNIQSTRQVIQWAFNNSKGVISDIYECQNGEYFVVAAIEGTLQAGYRSLASVSELLKLELLNKKKGEKLAADLKAKNFTTLEQYAEVMNTTPQSVKFVTFGTASLSGIGVEPVLNVEAPLAPLNEVAGPFAGKNRVYAIVVTDKREEPVADAETQKQQVQMQNMYRTYQLVQSPELLRENAKIVNNFSRFF